MSNDLENMLDNTDKFMSSMEELFFTHGKPFTFDRIKESISVHSTSSIIDGNPYILSNKLDEYAGYFDQDRDDFEFMLTSLQGMQLLYPQDSRIPRFIDRCNKCLTHIEQLRELVRSSY